MNTSRLTRNPESPSGDGEDFYGRVAALAASLAQVGRRCDAAKIEDAVAAGCTGLEILMRLRFELRAIRRADPALPSAIAREVKSLLAAINAALR